MATKKKEELNTLPHYGHDYRSLWPVVALIAALITAAVLAMSYKYCSVQEYFYVYDSIVFPAGTDFDHARELSTSGYNERNGDYWKRVAYLGIKGRCEPIEVW